MKTIETTRKGEKFTAVNIGKMSEVKDHRLQLAPGVEIQGKVFVGQALGATGSQMSFQSLVPGQDSGFLHTHSLHEELYIILKGEGLFQVDGEIFPISEGSIVRVAPGSTRALKNSGDGEMLMACVQYRADAFNDDDSTEATILEDKLTW